MDTERNWGQILTFDGSEQTNPMIAIAENLTELSADVISQVILDVRFEQIGSVVGFTRTYVYSAHD